MPVEETRYIGQEFERLIKNKDLKKELISAVRKYRPLVEFIVYDELGHRPKSNGEIQLFTLKAQNSGEMGNVRYAAIKIADIINANYEARE